jgi:predicted permease
MGIFRRLRATLFRSTLDRDFADEARFHVEELVDRFVAEGMPAAEARRLAERRVGNLAVLRDRTRDVDTVRWLSDAGQDLRFAVRTLARSPSFTVVAAVTLALGIGANTAIFTLFDALLLRALPVHDPAQLVLFTDDTGEGTSTGSPPTGRWFEFSLDVYRQLRDQPLGFESLGAVRSGESPVLARMTHGTAEPLRAQAHLVSGNYFSTLGVGAALGRTLLPSDDVLGAPPAAVVSDGFWRRRLNADPSVVGATAMLNQTPFTIVGIAPQEFFGERVRRPPDFWVPLAFQPQVEMRPSMLDRPDAYWLNLIGRLSPGASASGAGDASTIALRHYLTNQAGSKLTDARRLEIEQSYIKLENGASGVSSLRVRYSQPLHILLAVVGLILLLACANVANLLLTRAAVRKGEIAVRVALGAGRRRLMRQLLTESLVIAALGAICGALVAKWAVRGLLGLIASPTTPVSAALNLPVLGFTAAVTIAAGLLFGLVPALQASRFDLVEAIKVRRGSGGAAGGSTARVLVAVQIALSLVLLVGSALFARTLANLEAQPLGFDADRVLLVRISPRLAGYTPAGATALYQRVYDRLRALPGVRSVTFARYSPFSGSNSVNSGRIEGYTPRPGEDVDLETIQVGPSYPDALSMALVQGRAPGPADAGGAPKVAMVNEAFVRRYFPASSALGRHFTLDGSPDVEIVGVMRDARFRDASKPVPPAVFPAMLQETSRFALDCEFALRTDGDPAGASAEVRQALNEVAAGVPQNDPVLLRSQVASAFDSQRLSTRFIIFFGVLALALACVGVYGTIAQNVTNRTSEIGLRMALGAPAPAVLWLVVRQTAVLLGFGLLAGLPLAALSGRLVAAQLFGVRPLDPVSLAGAVLALVVAAAVASLVPARRAVRISAVRALRGD